MYKLLITWLCLPLAAWAQGEAAPASSAAPCNSAEHRQFDFWAGDWDVSQNGQPAGHNHIEIMLGGCALAEHWTSAQGGFAGSSLNGWDASRQRWHQTWVDNAGTVLHLDGGMVGGSMVLSGQRPDASGVTLEDRITWTHNADGSVRQHWETKSADGSWATAFDGLYVRAKATP